MQLLPALMLVALAATQTSAAPAGQEYDILNCTAYNMPPGIHHAYSNDCRRFYNCDNRGGGKITSCPAGLIYNRKKFICDFDAECESWDQQACYQGGFGGGFGQRNPNAMASFPALCCNEYYEYKCIDRKWTHKYCPPNQQFDPNSQQCSPQYQGGDCECGSPPSQDPCKGTNMEYVDNCHFRSTATGIETIQWCAQGTFMNPETCRCEGATDIESCKQPVQQCEDNDRSKYSLDISTGKFMIPKEGKVLQGYVGTVNVDFRQQPPRFSGPSSYAQIPFFQGNSLGPEFALRLQFTPDMNALSNENTVLSTAQLDGTMCNDGTKVTVLIRREMNRNVQVVFRAEGTDKNGVPSMAEISGSVASGFGGSPSVRMVVAVQRNAETQQLYLSGRIRSDNQQASDMRGNNVPVPFFENPISQNCALQLGGFNGTMSEFSFWRCNGPNNLLAL